MDLVGQVADPAAVDPLLKLLNDQEPAAVQSAARGSRTIFGSAHWRSRLRDPAECQGGNSHAGAHIALRPRASAALLLEAVDRGAIKPDQIPAAQLRQIALFQSTEDRGVARQALGQSDRRNAGRETGPDSRHQRIDESDHRRLVRGKPLFAKHCGICHTLFGEGNKIGPDLTGADRKNREFLLTSIVDPSAVVRKEFFNYVVATKDGRVLTGLLAESTPTTVTILDAKNQRTTVPTSDVDTIEPAAQSLMPEKILDELDADQVCDLMRYLQSDAPEPQPAQVATERRTDQSRD